MWLKYLYKVIDEFKCPLLTYTVNKDQGAFIPKTNCSLSIYKRRMTIVELILNIILVISL
jgi:hypothetical protein